MYGVYILLGKIIYATFIICHLFCKVHASAKTVMRWPKQQPGFIPASNGWMYTLVWQKMRWWFCMMILFCIMITSKSCILYDITQYRLQVEWIVWLQFCEWHWMTKANPNCIIRQKQPCLISLLKYFWSHACCILWNVMLHLHAGMSLYFTSITIY